MKRTLLLALCLLTVAFGFAQTETITIPWDFFVVPSDDQTNGDDSIYNSRISIEVGDTVEWVWQGSNFHNVKSVGDQAVESFGTPNNTGETNTTYSAPYTFSYTFTVLGENKFECTPHSSLMYGFITVVPEGTLSISKPQITNVSISPNPAKNNFTLNLNAVTSNSKLEVYDVLGKKILNRRINSITSTYDISNWNSGLYIIRLSSENTVLMKRFVKQ